MEMTNRDAVGIDQDLWVVQIKEGLESHRQEDEKEMFVSIYGVPRELLAMKAEAYIPHCISVGPYHHWRSQLFETERYKVLAARRFEKHSLTVECRFENVVEQVKKYDWQIRSSYQKYVELKEESLAWLMALDASFVLEWFHYLYVKGVDDQPSLQVSSQENRVGEVLHPSGTSTTHSAIMRDLILLENQLPLFLLQKLLEIQLGSQDKAEERLRDLVIRACEEWSPFVMKRKDSWRVCIKEGGHILEVLYHCIVPAAGMCHSIAKKNMDGNVPLLDSNRCFTRALKALWKRLSSSGVNILQLLSALAQRVFRGKAAELVTQLSTHLVSAFKTLSIIRRDETEEEKEEESGIASLETPPTRDELTIPSVSELLSAGFKFVPAEGDLNTIRFDPTTQTIYLPELRLEYHTEVVIRNLVAFEASAAPGALIFTRYTDFMNGIVDTEEDVRLLRKSGIISHHLADDGKVASLWNGMGKCVKLTKVKYLDQVIADVNKHYNSRWSVTVKKYVNKYIFGSWQLLTLLATGILLLLTCFQALCFVYDCKTSAHIFRN